VRRRFVWFLRQQFGIRRRTVWVAVRKDGKCWAGEWRWRGNTFTEHWRFTYRWGSERACRAAIELNGIRNAVPKKVRLDKNGQRRNKKRDH
jgi:hypothetical protein